MANEIVPLDIDIGDQVETVTFYGELGQKYLGIRSFSYVQNSQEKGLYIGGHDAKNAEVE